MSLCEVILYLIIPHFSSLSDKFCLHFTFLHVTLPKESIVSSPSCFLVWLFPNNVYFRFPHGLCFLWRSVVFSEKLCVCFLREIVCLFSQRNCYCFLWEIVCLFFSDELLLFSLKKCVFVFSEELFLFSLRKCFPSVQCPGKCWCGISPLTNKPRWWYVPHLTTSSWYDWRVHVFLVAGITNASTAIRSSQGVTIWPTTWR